MQILAATLKQSFVGRIPDQRVLETVVASGAIPRTWSYFRVGQLAQRTFADLFRLWDGPHAAGRRKIRPAKCGAD